MYMYISMEKWSSHLKTFNFYVYRVSNTFQMLVTIAIYSGRTLAAGILNHVLLNSRSSQSVRCHQFVT